MLWKRLWGASRIQHSCQAMSFQDPTSWELVQQKCKHQFIQLELLFCDQDCFLEFMPTFNNIILIIIILIRYYCHYCCPKIFWFYLLNHIWFNTKLNFSCLKLFSYILQSIHHKDFTNLTSFSSELQREALTLCEGVTFREVLHLRRGWTRIWCSK